MGYEQGQSWERKRDERTKDCTACGKMRPLAEFRRDKRTNDGRGARCVVCNRQSAARWREKNLDRALAKHREWRAAEPKKYILWRAKQRARKDGLTFAITAADISMPERCPVFGKLLNYNAGRNDPWTASLDRIDSSRGYVPGNVQVISRRANQIKNDATPDELRRLASACARHTNVLPLETAARNEFPLWDGLWAYFPAALAEVSRLSKIGNDQHNPGEPMHWAREKSTDHKNKILKHMLDTGPIAAPVYDADGVLHSVKMSWRSLAFAQSQLEALGRPFGENAEPEEPKNVAQTESGSR